MLSQSEIDQYHEAGYVIPGFPAARGDARRDPRRARPAAGQASRVPRLLLVPVALRHGLSELRAPAGDPRHGRAGARARLRALELELLRQARRQRQAHALASGRRVLADPAARAPARSWIAVDAATPENGCLRVIKGSHQERRLRRHRTVEASDVTLTQELQPDEYDERQAVDLELAPGQVSLHDVFLLHGSEANTSDRPRRGMTLRFMPTSSVFDRARATELYRSPRHHRPFGAHALPDARHRRSGQNDFRIRH